MLQPAAEQPAAEQPAAEQPQPQDEGQAAQAVQPQGHHRVQVWQRSNWKWYCKAEHWYDGSAAVVAQWDPGHPMWLAVTTAEGLHRQVRCIITFSSYSRPQLGASRLFHRCFNNGASVNRMLSTQQSFLQQLLATEELLLRSATAFDAALREVGTGGVGALGRCRLQPQAHGAQDWTACLHSTILHQRSTHFASVHLHQH